MSVSSTGLHARLLRAVVAHIPRHGFRLAAVRAALLPPAPPPGTTAATAPHSTRLDTRATSQLDPLPSDSCDNGGADGVSVLTTKEKEELRSSDHLLAQTLFLMPPPPSPGSPASGAADRKGSGPQDLEQMGLSDANPRLAQTLLAAWDRDVSLAAAGSLGPAGPQSTAYGRAVGILEERLRRSGSVREHLVDVRFMHSFP